MLTVVRNTQKHDLTVLINGQAYALPADSEKIIAKDIADEFLKVYPQYVSLVNAESLGSVTTMTVKPQTIFLANMTGDPDAPEFVNVKFFNRQTRFHDYHKLPNPKRKGFDVVNKMNGPMVEVEVGPGEPPRARNMPGQIITLPKYSIKEFPVAVGHWLLTRDNNSGPTLNGRVRPSRKPPEFRPTLQWKLDEIQAYLKLVDKSAPQEPSETTLKAKHKGNDEEFEEALNAAKLTAWKRTFFRIANPDYQLPTKEEFEAFRSKEQKSDLAATAARAANAVGNGGSQPSAQK